MPEGSVWRTILLRKILLLLNYAPFIKVYTVCKNIERLRDTTNDKALSNSIQWAEGNIIQFTSYNQ